MSKSHDAKKNVKQKPLKTLKEKQREKKAKKRLKTQIWTGIDNYAVRGHNKQSYARGSPARVLRLAALAQCKRIAVDSEKG